MFNKMERMSIFNNRYKFPAHMVTLLLIIAAMVITGVRLVVKTGPSSRSDTMALAMGAKSLIIIAYQLLSEHIQRFQKWASLKANAILNGLEIVFWSAVCLLSFQGLVKSGGCTGTACPLGWVVLVLAVIIIKMEMYIFLISYLDFRFFKRNSKPRGQTGMEVHEAYSI